MRATRVIGSILGCAAALAAGLALASVAVAGTPPPPPPPTTTSSPPPTTTSAPPVTTSSPPATTTHAVTGSHPKTAAVKKKHHHKHVAKHAKQAAVTPAGDLTDTAQSGPISTVAKNS